MSLILISVIGSPGDPSKPETQRYREAKYDFGDSDPETTEFFFTALIKRYRPEVFYLLGTEKSIWDRVDEVKKNFYFDYQKVLIPFGVNEAEIWKIFETIVSLDLSGKEVVIDVTHGFRSIPFAVFMAVSYFKAVRQDVVVRDVLYGNFEAGRRTGIAPVVKLNSLLDMNEWIRAARRFIQYGDGDLLIEKLSGHDSEGQLREFLNAFSTFVDNLRLNYVSQIVPSAKKLIKTYRGSVKEHLHQIAPFKLLEPLIKKRLQILLMDEPEWRKQWRVADWFFASRQYSQAVIVLRECHYTFICELMGLKIWSRFARENQAKEIIYYLKSAYEPAKKQLRIQLSQTQSKSLSKIAELISGELFQRWACLLCDVDETRNRVGHALMRGGEKKETEIEPGQQISKIAVLIQETAFVLEKIDKLPTSVRVQLSQLLKAITKNSPPRLYLIVNEGVHPIVEDLKQQFGENIEYEVVTRGNVTLEEEAQVARRVKEILEKHHGREIVIVPSGLPYLITVVYNTVYQITSKHPVYLQ
ncbi:MAG: TIGR02221 family CRISPR-associated protein, partial [Calditrichaeota bacterium]